MRDGGMGMSYERAVQRGKWAVQLHVLLPQHGCVLVQCPAPVSWNDP
jgi:hypothetical protein